MTKNRKTDAINRKKKLKTKKLTNQKTEKRKKNT